MLLLLKGKFNEKSEGVKVLNDEKMSKVVGGFYYVGAIPIFGFDYFTAYYGIQASDYNYKTSEFQKISRQNLKDNEVFLYAQRYRNQYRENSQWLAAYNPTTKTVREIPFSASISLFNELNQNHRYQFGNRF
ncbi:MAG: hypothetical protein K2I63_02070 [Helicobacter sp.]|nr:hypothetical protein [Helicobacter sp.]